MNKKRAAGVLATVVAVFFLAACASETVLETSAPQTTAEPTAVPTPTPIPYEDFAGAMVPPADPERLAQLTNLLSLVPENFSSTIFLDMEFLRSNDTLVSLISPEILGMDTALPSIATGLVDSIAVATDFQALSVITPFQSNYAIGDILRLAGGFGLQLGGDGPTTYEGHDVWRINARGTALAMATANESTGVAASGQGLSAEEVRAVVEGSIDAFDGWSSALLDTAGLADLLGDVPSGFAGVVLSECETLPLFTGMQGLPGCTAVVVTADILSGDLVVFHSLIGFTGQDEAASVMQRTIEALEDQSSSHDFEDLGVRQEDGNLRVRVIVNVSKFTEVFRLFSPNS